MEAFALRPDWDLLLSIGTRMSVEQLPPAPPNVTVRNWFPQLEVLSRASLMIHHAGIGTVKECILARVPMVAFPLMRDQFDCASRLVRLHLALSASIESATPESLIDLVERTLSDQTMQRNLAAMSDAFVREDNIGAAVDVVEAALYRAAAG
jgi:MGT family glycosyltransferase